MLDKGGGFNLRVRHKENNHHFDLVDEREEVEQSCDVVENRVEDPGGSRLDP